MCSTALAQNCPWSRIFEHGSVLVVMAGRQVQIFERISPMPAATLGKAGAANVKFRDSNAL